MADSKRRLSRKDWIDAAIAMGAEQGFDRIAVDALAPRLGATRGSFYWHFRDRAELVQAVLEEWERAATSNTIERLQGVSADEALEQVISAAFNAGHLEDQAEWRLIGMADDPQIGPVVARVHQRRLAFIEQLLTAKGLPDAEAAERARLAYVAYLGWLALRQLEPDGPNLGPALLRLIG